MNKRVETLTEEMRKLTPEERQELLVRLYLLTDDDEPAEGTPEEIDQAWIEEVDRRMALVESGESSTSPIDEALARIQAARRRR